jgi:hypothetical protein
MTLMVTKVSEAFYTAVASPPNVREKWETEKPLRMHQLLDQLLALGIHQIDASDAINDADRVWFRQSLEAKNRPKPGDRVILKECPAGLLDDLPAADQQAISTIIGKPVQLNEYDVDGRAELEFTDADGVIHFLFVRPEFIGVA